MVKLIDCIYNKYHSKNYAFFKRFHFPVDGRIGENKPIPGDYYTVNPMAIRSE